ncbi:MAG TPA: hypothetical protein VH593_06130 [Ktedonobacteraceae bacterium]|jgi:hypothetical protein
MVRRKASPLWLKLNYLRVRLAYRWHATGYRIMAERAYFTGAAPKEWRCGWCRRMFKPIPYQTVRYLRTKRPPNACPKCR